MPRMEPPTLLERAEVIARLTRSVEADAPQNVLEYIENWAREQQGGGRHPCETPTSSTGSTSPRTPGPHGQQQEHRSPRVVIEAPEVVERASPLGKAGRGGYSSGGGGGSGAARPVGATRRPPLKLSTDLPKGRKSSAVSSSSSPRQTGSPTAGVPPVSPTRGVRRRGSEGRPQAGGPARAGSGGRLRASARGSNRGDLESQPTPTSSQSHPRLIGNEALAKTAEEVLLRYAALKLPSTMGDDELAERGVVPPMPRQYYPLIVAMKNLVEEQQQRITLITSQLNDTAYQPHIVLENARQGGGKQGPGSGGGAARENLVIGMCNPLLDMHLSVDASYLDRWGLEADGATLASEAHIALFEEMAADPRIEYVPGGAGLNTIRVAQWILGVPNSTAFVGTTGLDAFGEKLRTHTVKEGVLMHNLTIDSDKTGTCAVLTSDGNKRSLVANLGASAVFKEEWLASNAALKTSLDEAHLLYITGFFLRTAPLTVLGIMERAARAGKHVCLNLSAPFVVHALGPRILDALQHADLLFGNNGEFQCLDEVLQWNTEGGLAAIAAKVQAYPGRANRAVVITQGSDDLLVCDGAGMESLVTPQVPSDEIVDTNGAGDAFVGGFLAKYAIGGDVRECVKIGQWAASVIIRRPGCTIPPLPPGCSISIGNVDDLATRRPTVSHTIRAGRMVSKQGGGGGSGGVKSGVPAKAQPQKGRPKKSVGLPAKREKSDPIASLGKVPRKMKSPSQKALKSEQ